MRELAVFVVVALAQLGCGQRSQYSCTGSNECISAGAQGICEPQGFCAFADPMCPSGERYEPNAGGGLAGQCVAPGTGIDASTDGLPANCGGVGMACCQGEAQACMDNAFCQSGTCQQCVTDVAIGGSHICALKYDGSVWCAGANDRGQIGTGVVGGANSLTRTSPVRDSANSVVMDATALVGGDGDTCVLRTGGTVWCWGKNDDGQIGPGPTSIGAATQITRASDGTPLTGMVSLAAGHDMVCAVDAGHTAWCWGENVDGQLGDGTTTGRPRAAPILVAAGGAPFANVADVSTNDVNTACLHTTDDQIWCWGNNDSGTIGDGTFVAKSVPVHIADGVSVAVGRRHVLAVENDHTVFAWGSNGHLRMATQNGDSSTPAQSLSSSNAPFGGVASVAAAGVSCALMMNGDLYCWGANVHGQVGTGIGTDRPMPVIRTFNGAPLHDVKKVIATYSHTCAILNDGEVLCWGNGGSGEFGDGTKASRNYPGTLPLTCP